jgi:intracellular septation protein A
MTQVKVTKKENSFLSLLINIVAPTVILIYLSGEEYLGIKTAVVVALSLPLLYGIREFINTKKLNMFSVLGLISILLTGAMTLLELPPQYIAIKEAAIPGLLALVTLISLKTRYPLVKIILYNDKIMQIDKVGAALNNLGNQDAFERVLINASLLLAASFVLSSILNYMLATIMLISEPGTEAFNTELGKMNALSFPVIAIPATAVMLFALFYLFKQIKQLTRLELDEILIQR